MSYVIFLYCSRNCLVPFHWKSLPSLWCWEVLFSCPSPPWHDDWYIWPKENGADLFNHFSQETFSIFPVTRYFFLAHLGWVTTTEDTRLYSWLTVDPMWLFSWTLLNTVNDSLGGKPSNTLWETYVSPYPFDPGLWNSSGWERWGINAQVGESEENVSPLGFLGCVLGKSTGAKCSRVHIYRSNYFACSLWSIFPISNRPIYMCVSILSTCDVQCCIFHYILSICFPGIRLIAWSDYSWWLNLLHSLVLADRKKR